MRYLTTILAVCVFNVAFAGKIDKGFERLAVKDYFWAKDYFERAYKKEPVAASYGLSLVYGLKNSPFWQIDSAYKQIVFADTAYPNAESKDFDDLVDYGITLDTIHHHRQHISDQFWERTTKLNTVAAYQNFIDAHPWANQVVEAEERRNKLAFDNASASGKWQDYLLFMETYPEASQFGEAESRYIELFYIDFVKDDKITSYLDYILSYPESPYIERAEDRVFEIYTASGSVDVIHDFIVQFPDNHNVAKAWSMLYAKSTTGYSPEAITEFLLDYPEYPYRENVMDDLTLAKTKFIPFYKDDLWGYINPQGQVMIEPQFDEVDVFSEGLAVFESDGYYGYLNKKGEVVIEPVFFEAYSFKNGLALVETEDYFGLINIQGLLVADTIYDDLGENKSGLIYASIEETYGYLNAEGEVVLDFVYDEALAFENGRAVVQMDGLYGTINAAGEWLIKPAYEWLEPLNEYDVCRAKGENGFYGLLNAWGDTVMDFKYAQIGEFSCGLFYAIEGQDYSYYNAKGEAVVKGVWDVDNSTASYATFVDCYAKYKSKNKFGIIDTIGERVYPAIFEAVGQYNDYTAVKKRGLWGYANKDVRLVHDYIYDWAGDYQDSVAIVKYKGRYGVIDLEANFIVDATYLDMEWMNEDRIIVRADNGVGLISISQGELISPEWSNIAPINDHLIRCSSDEGMAIFDIWVNDYIYHHNHP